MANVLGLIPCRGGSKGIPHKNIQPVAGKPLLAHSIEASRRSKRIDRTLVSTDDKEIRNAAREAGADAPFLRPEELATDEAPIEPTLKHALDFVKDHGGDYHTLVLLQATSPLRTSAHIDEALKRYEATDAGSLVAVSEDHSYRWQQRDNGAKRINYDTRKRRQNKKPEYVESGAIYIVDVERLLKTGDLQAGKTTLYVLDQVAALDIDEPFELWFADKILREWRL
jgi:CMP-N,N'-diacetyllegionaminic acid synthase